MNSSITQFCQSLTIPCGFTDAESEVYTNAAIHSGDDGGIFSGAGLFSWARGGYAR